MIKIENRIIKKQKNFWNNVVFHPTDAIEDPWGKRILDQASDDGALKTIRIYSMFEDIIYLDENGKLCYDFRLSDLRLDYLISKGYDLLISYAGIPDCIASSTENKTSVSKNKTRYKGKLWNTSPPANMEDWEEICYEYTKHNVERYGIETVKNWNLQCFNEPDIPCFFFSNVEGISGGPERLNAYCEMYKAFAKGITKVSEEIRIGGPALAIDHGFLGGFLDYVKLNGLKLDFVSVHSYGTTPDRLNDNSLPFCVDSIIKNIKDYKKVIDEHGFADIPLLVDEWGMASAGFFNIEECSSLIAREHEVFSAYFVKLIRAFIDSGMSIDMLALCLSGQHEMVEDFSGFRNFFTLNFIKKPIYNSFILASKLGSNILDLETENKNISIIPTKNEESGYSVLLSYSSEFFDENLETVDEKLVFSEDINGKTVTIWCIDKENTNPYRLYQKLNIIEPNHEELKQLREEGLMKPTKKYIVAGNEIDITMNANSVFLIEVK